MPPPLGLYFTLQNPQMPHPWDLFDEIYAPPTGIEHDKTVIMPHPLGNDLCTKFPLLLSNPHLSRGGVGLGLTLTLAL